MPVSALHFIYLDRRVLHDPQWNHLHRFLHPRSHAEEGDALMVGAGLDISHPQLLSIRAIEWEHHTGSRVVLLHHALVASILEVASRKSQFGFVDLNDARAILKDQS